MENFKLARNLMLFIGLAMLFCIILSLLRGKSLAISNLIVGTFAFIDAYINHKKFIKNIKDKNI